jgi:aminoglycoside 6'-N-acetyltransferase
VTVSFRPLRRGDFSLLSTWFAKPHIEPWWREPHDIPSIEAQYGPSIDGGDPTEVFIIEQGGEPIGLVQRYLIDENPGWKRSLAVAGIPPASAGIDYLLGEEALTGQGLGPRMIDRFVAETWQRYPDVSAIVIAIRQENRRSWRAVEKSGFERTWAGLLDSDDPSDDGPNYVYVRYRG